MDEKINVNETFFKDLTFFIQNSLKIKKKYFSKATFNSIKGNYNNLEYKASFGFGQFSKTPWIAFLGYNQEVQKGIYPLILFNTEVNTNNFEICYGISKNNTPNINWGIKIIQYLENSKTKKYSNMFVKKHIQLILLRISKQILLLL